MEPLGPGEEFLAGRGGVIEGPGGPVGIAECGVGGDERAQGDPDVGVEEGEDDSPSAIPASFGGSAISRSTSTSVNTSKAAIRGRLKGGHRESSGTGMG
jgi:hypothetical protein